MTDARISCAEASRLILRRADGLPLDRDAARLDAHLAGCASCREALADQQRTAALLRDRPMDEVSPALRVRLAARLDAETQGGGTAWLDLADWRQWTFRLAPIAAGLALAAFLLADRADPQVSLDAWTAAASSEAQLLSRTDVTSDAVLESMLTATAEPGGGGDVR